VGRPIAQRLAGQWNVTLQSGLPFTPQLSYNPSNDVDTRNPVRPSWNPSFTGPVILGGPDQYFNPLAFIQPLPGTYGMSDEMYCKAQGSRRQISY
jgi:hypothetical protein